ncbi:hypothetical protein GURASL_02220 [Geotalea uraniireducens]|uniref:Uncharacterized protein n=2 Tax=Geotalea uraniireducens TaxID=351604 RepID=A0ABM8EG96_9BACT|nr:hypothetical protein GURASL_02220 [Geotalea uraniireducens]
MLTDRLSMLACVIRYSLVPASRRAPPVPLSQLPLPLPPGEFMVVSRTLVARWLASPGQFGDCATGMIATLFPDCPAIGGPFLLFRLKRLGFSGARVKVVKEGLLVCASR